MKCAALAAVPAEPEAWEWRHVRASDCAAGKTVRDPRHLEREVARDAGHLERRRPGTAPGEWERVDPEPRRACAHSSPLNYDGTRHATCTLDESHDGRHRQGDLAWTDRTMPCREADPEPREEPCTAHIAHGPGHQSKTYCEVRGPHEVHEATYGECEQRARWRDGGYTDLLRVKGIEFNPESYPENMAMTGFHDEPPPEPRLQDGGEHV